MFSCKTMFKTLFKTFFRRVFRFLYKNFIFLYSAYVSIGTIRYLSIRKKLFMDCRYCESRIARIIYRSC